MNLRVRNADGIVFNPVEIIDDVLVFYGGAYFVSILRKPILV